MSMDTSAYQKPIRRKSNLILLILALGVAVILPLTLFLTRQRQDIRPRALQGQANLLLNSDYRGYSNLGEDIHVLVSTNLTDTSLKVSGADIILLYDRNKLEVRDLVPALTKVSSIYKFTDAPVVSYGGRYDDTYNFLRVAVVAKKSDSELPSGNVNIARVTFRAIKSGTANIKFPEDNSKLQLVGLGKVSN